MVGRTVVATVALAVCWMVWLPAESAAQCAMCRTAFQSPEGRALLEAFRSGIVFLLAAPYLTFGLILFLALRARRRTTGAEAREEGA
ncbi:MAG: hypothetical protein QF681_14845 [Vicinamibacterales bacterium]|jgi:hypothetical protein|nr:hypothetical protein [Vicinamibacterales bacterium]